MPNWCANHIEISGPEDKINALWEKIEETDNLLEHLSPIGEYNREDALSKWGCKWDVDPASLELQHGMIRGYMESPWSPPIAAVDNFLSANPDCDVDLYYFEPAMDFAGSYHHGDVTISEQEKDFWIDVDLGQQLDSHFAILEMVEEHEYDTMCEVIATPPDVLINPED